MLHNPGAWEGGQPNVCVMLASDLTQCMSDLADIPLALFALNIQRWVQQLYSST